MTDLPDPTFRSRAATSSAPDASVRPARSSDALGIASTMLESWRRGSYADVLAGELAGLSPADVTEDWRSSIADPPTPRHLVLVALEGPALVGYAVVAPAGGAEAGGGEVGEVVDLVVHPDHTRAGHGSRLLAASVEHLRAQGCSEVVTWCVDTDVVRRAFLESAGLVPDGGARRLDMGPGTPGLTQVSLGAALD
jgi:GNAT superfamily N-acetyltransferase